MNSDIKSELFEVVRREFPTLAGLGPDRVYDTLSGICAKEGKPITVEEMLKYAVVIDDDLEHDSLL